MFLPNGQTRPDNSQMVKTEVIEAKESVKEEIIKGYELCYSLLNLEAILKLFITLSPESQQKVRAALMNM